MKKNFKKMVVALLVFSFIFGLAVNKKVSSAYTISERFSVTPLNLARVAIPNVNEKNDVTVTFTAYPDILPCATQVDIYKNMNFTGSPVTTKVFNRGNHIEPKFVLPAGKTYYAKISSYTGDDITGTFIATY
ncbi:MAG: hypothetical protein K2K70_00790 [Lachnospiraceae bacterium]|nr:hypothetical protein [Lachnospiraceae bacterium]